MNREIKFRGKRIDNGEWVHYWEFEKYGVNKDGKVCSFDYNHSGLTQEIKQYTDKDGYKYVFLVIENKRYKRFVHRMIISTFVDNIENKPQVNHKNGIRDDNRLENLEWVTAQENCLHSFRCNGRKMSKKQIECSRLRFSKTNNPKSKINQEIANKIREDRNNGLQLRDLSKKYNLSISQCGQICKNKFWKVDNSELLGEQ